MKRLHSHLRLKTFLVDSSRKTRFKIRHSLKWFAEQDMYRICSPYAKNVKIVLQMLVGVVLVVILLLQAFSLLGIPFLAPLINRKPLELVSYALFYSSGIELAYMLFTPDPDEAVEPLIVGLAAAILLGISDFKIPNAEELLISVLALAALFIINRIFLKKRSDNF